MTAVRAMLIVVALAGCERAKAPVNGIGEFELVKTTLGSVEPTSLACQRSQAEPITRCWVDARQSIAGRAPKIELVFAGHEPDALLAEILLEVPGCNLGELRSWFGDKLGAPTEESGERITWAQKYIYLAIRVTGPSRCLVTAVSPVDTERIERIKR